MTKFTFSVLNYILKFEIQLFAASNKILIESKFPKTLNNKCIVMQTYTYR